MPWQVFFYLVKGNGFGVFGDSRAKIVVIGILTSKGDDVEIAAVFIEICTVSEMVDEIFVFVIVLVKTVFL